jgi:hypothetical protein
MLIKNISKINLDYMILIPGRSFYSQTVVSLLQLQNYLNSIGSSYYFSIKYAPLISKIRNELITGDPINLIDEKDVLFQNNIKAKKIIFIDSDMVFTVEDFKKLIESDESITIAPYALPNGNSCISLPNSSGKLIDLKNLKDYKYPFEVDFGGLGFASIKSEVFEKIQYPWFSVSEGEISMKNGYGEDVYFFRKAKENGFKVICNPNIRPGHLKQIVLY